MRKVTTSQIIKDCKLENRLEEVEENDSQSRFYAFFLQIFVDSGYDDPWILVESTATEWMNEVSRWPIGTQTLVIAHLASLVPEPGDSVVIIKDHHENNKKGRAMMVTCLKPVRKDEISLLITR